MSSLTQTRDHARTMAKKGGADSPLWTQIADEIDEYLHRPAEAEDLFGEVTAEPIPASDERTSDERRLP